jgi:hypothetical protein
MVSAAIAMAAILTKEFMRFTLCIVLDAERSKVQANGVKIAQQVFYEPACWGVRAWQTMFACVCVVMQSTIAWKVFTLLPASEVGVSMWYRFAS